MHACLHDSARLYVCMYVCLYVCMCVRMTYMHACVHTYIHTLRRFHREPNGKSKPSRRTEQHLNSALHPTPVLLHHYPTEPSCKGTLETEGFALGLSNATTSVRKASDTLCPVRTLQGEREREFCCERYRPFFAFTVRSFWSDA